MSVTTEKPAAATTIRPFRAEIAEEELADLRRRLAATRWPDPETVPDQSQGAQLSKLQGLVRYWGNGLRLAPGRGQAERAAAVRHGDRRAGHPLHPRPLAPRDAMPVIVTHGWPGSVFELLKVIGPLTDPTAYGGTAQDAFHLVIPSLPGYGFSGRPQAPGWDPDRIAHAWDELMKRLGYTRYVAQGGDWGAVVTEAMGRQAPAGLRGIHVNLAAAVPPDVEAALAGDRAGAGDDPSRNRPCSTRWRLPQERVLGLLRGADRAAASGRIRPDRLPGWPGGVLPVASRVRAVDVRRRSRRPQDR